jgi:spore maturation protein SpmB
MNHPPAAALVHFPPWAIAAILAAAVVPSAVTTLIMLAREHARRGRRVAAAATRRGVIGAAVCGAVILTVMLGTVRPRAPADSSAAGCTALLSGHQIAAADYPRIRAEFAASRWPDLRAAGTSYVDLAVKLRTERNIDGYLAVWFYQRLSIACGRHDRRTSAVAHFSSPEPSLAPVPPLPPPATVPVQSPPWAIPVILAATVILSVATTLITLALDTTRRARVEAMAAPEPQPSARTTFTSAARCNGDVEIIDSHPPRDPT